MGNVLRKLGELAYTKKWWFIAGWLVVLVLLAGVAATQYKAPSSSITIPGTQAMDTLDRFAELFPDAGKGSARVVLESHAGSLRDRTSEVEALTAKLQTVPGVSQVISPATDTSAISADGMIAYISLQLADASDDVTDATRQGVLAAVEAARSDTLAVEMGGDVIDKAPGEILGVGEVAGVVLALAVLVITLGSLVAAGLPIVVAMVTVGVSMAGLFGLSHVVDITSTTPVLAVMLGLAVGIDYSLFIVNKYRHYLLQGYSNKEAAGRSVATAGNAVVFAALTVVIALSALAIVQIPFMTTMGLAAAATVALAALVAISFLPALLGVTGQRVFRGKTRRAIAEAQARGPKESHRTSHTSLWYRWGEAITKHPVWWLVGAVVIIAAIAWPVRSLALGLPTDEYAATTTTERKAYDMLTRGFGAGFNGPLLVLAENVTPVSEADRAQARTELETMFNKQVAAETAKQTTAFQRRAAAAQTPEELMQVQADAQAAQAAAPEKIATARAQLEPQIQQYADRYQLVKITDALKNVDGVKEVTPLLVTGDTTKGVIRIIPTTGPSDQKTIELITKLRDQHYVAELTQTPNILFGVTGSTALQNDINTKLAAALPQYLAVVVGLSLVLLVVVFRSILVPLKATAGFLLSVLAMFGAIVMVFQWGWFGIADAPGPIVSFIPIIAIGVLFGLAMDYEFFLVSSMHEEYSRTRQADKAVVSGFAIGSRVVVAAGVIMVAVFAGFVTNHDATIQAIGFGLAVGILVDAFLVRLIIVPAVMKLLGKSAWWLPAWLDRLLPHVSIEGEAEQKIGK